jgi:hypothetical protein
MLKFWWQHSCYVWWTCFSTDTIHIGTNWPPITVNFDVQVKVWSRLIYIRRIFYFKLNGTDAINEITRLKTNSERTSSRQRNVKLKPLYSRYNIWLSPSAIPLQHLTTLPSMQLFPTERQVNGVGPTLYSERTSSRQRNVKLKPLYEAFLMRIQEQVSENRSTVCTNMYGVCWKTCPPNIATMLSSKFEHVGDIS